jgi:hypothetical protein
MLSREAAIARRGKMTLTKDLGRRVELVPLDRHFRDITIALYAQQRDGGTEYLTHTYSRLEGARDRIAFVTKAAATLGGMQPVDGRLRFPCGAPHQLAAKRVFLEASKLPPSAVLEPKPLTIADKKSGRNIMVLSLGAGVYQLTADGNEEGKVGRVEAVTSGLKKLGEMAAPDGCPDRLAFSCGHCHDGLVGLLLIRALNVRAVLREQEMAASRGILVAPSAQE